MTTTKRKRKAAAAPTESLFKAGQVYKTATTTATVVGPDKCSGTLGDLTVKHVRKGDREDDVFHQVHDRHGKCYGFSSRDLMLPELVENVPEKKVELPAEITKDFYSPIKPGVKLATLAISRTGEIIADMAPSDGRALTERTLDAMTDWLAENRRVIAKANQ